MAGHFGLTADWRLEGWCWFPDRPADRPAIDITVNGAMVQTCVASQLNEAVRDSGLGDGRYGFSLSIPAEAIGDAVLEAQERRSGLVLGRVTFGSGADPLREAALARLEREVADCFARLRAPDLRLDAIATAIEVFGAGLSAHRRGPDSAANHPSIVLAGLDPAIHAVPPPQAGPIDRGSPTKRGASVAPIAAWMAGSSPAMTEPEWWIPHAPPIAPELSLVVLASAWEDNLAALRHAKALLPDAEFLLIASGPETIVGAGRIAWVKIIPVVGDPVQALNHAVLSARGDYLCVVDAPRDFLAVGIEDHLRNGAPARFGSGAATRLATKTVHWLPPARPDGIAALLRRRDLLAVGGFDAADGRVDWSSLAAKLAALGRPIDAAPHRPAAHRMIERRPQDPPRAIAVEGKVGGAAPEPPLGPSPRP